LGGSSSDVVDELLKPFQSYLSIYRTGQYHGHLGDILGVGGQGAGGHLPAGIIGSGIVPNENNYGLGLGGNGAHQQRSPEKKYRIKSVKMPQQHQQQQQQGGGDAAAAAAAAGGGRGNNSQHQHQHHPSSTNSPAIKQHLMNTEKPMISAALKNNVNGYNNSGGANGGGNSASQPEMPTAIKPSHVMNACPPPMEDVISAITPKQQEQQQQRPIQAAPHQQQQQLQQAAPMPAAAVVPVVQQQQQQANIQQGRSLSKFDKEGTPSSVTSTSSKMSTASSSSASSSSSSSSSSSATSSLSMPTTEKSSCSNREPAAAVAAVAAAAAAAAAVAPAIAVEEVDQPAEPVVVEKDVFGLYSLTFVSRSRDLSERKLRMDFDKFGEIARIRGQFGPGESVIVSYGDKLVAERCCAEPALLAKYPTLCPAPAVTIVPDKDGHFSIEFSNSGMSGIREITQEFSKHGEVVKVMASGAKSNAVKRVTVSYADKQSAFDAVNAAHDRRRKNKDFQNVDFAKECVLET